MITEHITYDKAEELIERAIEERGADYVYDPPGTDYCAYFHIEDGTPRCGCIVGLALSYIGLTYADVEDGLNTDTHATKLLVALGVTCTPEAGRLLDLVQEYQDAKFTWGDAYTTAKTRMIEDG